MYLADPYQALRTSQERNMPRFKFDLSLTRVDINDRDLLGGTPPPNESLTHRPVGVPVGSTEHKLIQTARETRDRLKRSHLYEEALASKKELQVLRESAERAAIERERKRQVKEKRNFERARVVELERIREINKQEFASAQKSANERIQSVKDRQFYERVKLMRNIESTRKPPVKFSPAVNEALYSQARLSVVNERFGKAIGVRDSLRLPVASQIESFYDELNQKSKNQQDAMKKAHKLQMQLAKEKAKKEVIAAKKKNAKRMQVAEQRLRNLAQDLTHVHINEFLAPREVGKSKKKSRPNFKTSTTYLGTNKLNALAVGQKEIPSVCAHHDWSDMIPEKIRKAMVPPPPPPKRSPAPSFRTDRYLEAKDELIADDDSLISLEYEEPPPDPLVERMAKGYADRKDLLDRVLGSRNAAVAPELTFQLIREEDENTM